MACRNPPTMTAREEAKDGCYLTIGTDDGGRTCGVNSFGSNDSNTVPALINVKNDMMKLHREPKILYPDVAVRGLSHAMDRVNTIPAHCLMNRAVSSLDYGKSVTQMNFMPPRCEATAGYPVKAHGVEARRSLFGRPQMMGNFSSSKCSTTVLPLVQSFGVTGNKNDFNIISHPFSSPQTVDRNFLTLGIGSGTEIRSNSNSSTEEIASKLEDAVSLRRKNSLVGQSPLSFSQLKGKNARIQTNGGGMSSLARDLADRMSTREGGLVADSKLNSSLFHGLQAPQANAQSDFSTKPSSSVFDQTPSSLPFGRPLISQLECVPPTLVASQINIPTYFASQSVSREHDYGRQRSMNVPSEPYKNFVSDRQRGSSISHAQLGNLSLQEEISRREAAWIGSFLPSGQLVGTSHNMGSVEALGNNLFCERNRFQMLRGNTLHSAAAASPFPKRLGVQPNNFSNARTTTGCSPVHLAAPVKPFRPSVPSGQHGVPAQPYNGFPELDNGRVMAPPSRFPSYPSMKRPATESPSTPRMGQRRKIFPQHHIIQNSAPLQRQSVPAAPVPIPAAVHIPPSPIHIKCQGFDGPFEPIGQRCLLCKRDLSFTAEGLAYQPAIPPAVAVLPCGHTFHDHCLQIITPENQSKIPPCIPCATGET